MLYEVIITIDGGYVATKVDAGDKDEALIKAEDKFWGRWDYNTHHHLYYGNIEVNNLDNAEEDNV